MSGFEAAGIVLAVWPIAVQAVELYRIHREPDGFKRAAERLYLQLKTEEKIYHNFVDHLLSTNVEEAELLQLKSGRSIASWENPELHAKMEDVLGAEDFKLVCLTVCDILELLQLLKEEFTKIEQSKSKVLSIRLLKASRTGSSFERRITHLKEHNLRLTQLVKRTEKPRQTPLCTPVEQIAPPLEVEEVFSASNFKLYHHHVSSIHGSLYDGFHCECTEPHCVDFRVDAPLLSGLSQNNFELRFKSYFDKDSQDNGEASGHHVVTIIPQDPLDADDDISQIGDFCQLVQTLGVQNVCKALASSSTKTEYHLFYDKPQTPTSSKSSAKALPNRLGDYLTGTPVPFKARLWLARAVSWTIVQLHSTPWISDRWDKQDLYVLPQAPPWKNTSFEVFISKYFRSTNDTQWEGSEPLMTKDNFLWEMIDDPALFSLGCFLTELAFGKKLEDMADPDAPKCDITLIRCVTARRLLKSGKLEQEMGRKYNDVVRACLTSDLGDRFRRGDLDLEHFHQRVYEDVLTPLENVWIQFNSIS